MKVFETLLPEVKIIDPELFDDCRGSFHESFNQHKFDQLVQKDVTFVQDNHSVSKKGVLRGLHYQVSPCSQGKLVRVASGAVFDVAVDIRNDSSNFGKWVGVELSSNNHRQLWIPAGFAHGFQVLSDVAVFLYKTTNFYSPKHERSISWDDKDLNINWPYKAQAIVSEKDRLAQTFRNMSMTCAPPKA
jgi:dTDP-4-dehydrorhamnose 3,5-epimerase